MHHDQGEQQRRDRKPARQRPERHDPAPPARRRRTRQRASPPWTTRDRGD
jgi:hypothetical protein